jgi:hypothetical protein
MAEQSKRSPIQEYVVPEELDALNLQEDNGETRVTTPLPSSAGEASTEINSAMSPQPSASQEKGSGKEAARPFHARLLDEEADNSSAKADTLPLKKRISFHRNEPNKEETLPHAASKSVHSQEKCRGEEDERKVVNLKGCIFGWRLCPKKRRFRIARTSRLLIKKKERNSAMNPPAPAALQETGSSTQLARPSLDRLVDEKLLDISSAMPAKRPLKMKFFVSGNKKKMEDKLYIHSVGEDENPRNDEQNESFTQRVLRDVYTEIGLLNAIIDYYAINGMYPFHDLIHLPYFITYWLQVDIPEEKLIALVNDLRKKYLSNMARKGTIVSFADPRDQISFHLAHKIWGGGSNEEYWKGLKLIVKWS